MQQIYCVLLLQKCIRDCYSNLNEKNICNNGKFWKVVKALLPKIVSNEKITLVEWGEIIKTNQVNAKLLNILYSNIIKNLEIPLCNQTDPICHNIKDPVIKAIIK